MITKLNTDRFIEDIEIAVKNYIERLSSEDLLKLSEQHFDMFDYGMTVDRIIDKELARRDV